MDKLGSLLVWLHISGNIVWIGSILAVGVILASPAGDLEGTANADPRSTLKIRGEIALRVYMRLAVPAFVLSFACGATRLLMNTSYYLVEHHWMHPKLLVAVAVIGLHHVIGARAKAASKADATRLRPDAPEERARGTVQEARSTAMLSAVLAVMAVLAAFFAIFRIPS
jgi:protoporphyrinogen IX oxidase